LKRESEHEGTDQRFEDLSAWQKARALTSKIYRVLGPQARAVASHWLTAPLEALRADRCGT
jgi:type II secretory pathway component PulK